MDDGPRAWRFLLRAIAAADGDEQTLMLIGIGDLKSLLIHHGDEVIDAVESEAPHNPSLRQALKSVRMVGEMRERISRLVLESP
jgi:hypothetical protein